MPTGDDDEGGGGGEEGVSPELNSSSFHPSRLNIVSAENDDNDINSRRCEHAAVKSQTRAAPSRKEVDGCLYRSSTMTTTTTTTRASRGGGGDCIPSSRLRPPGMSSLEEMGSCVSGMVDTLRIPDDLSPDDFDVDEQDAAVHVGGALEHRSGGEIPFSSLSIPQLDGVNDARKHNQHAATSSSSYQVRFIFRSIVRRSLSRYSKNYIYV